MQFFTKVISPIFRVRQRQLEQFGTQADTIQQRQLAKLIDEAKNTEWGKQYGFRDFCDYRTFSERVPLQTYEEVKPYVERMIRGERSILWPSNVKWYAKSSGTTNDKSKYIPVSREILFRCHYRGGFDSVALYLQNNPKSNFFDKKGLILGGSHSPAVINSHAHQGDLSAVMIQNLPAIIDLLRVPPKRVILMGEWESKINAIVDYTWKKKIGSLSGIPSWMLTLIEAVLKKTGKDNLLEVWPDLEVFFHGGVSFKPYRERYKELIPSDSMHYMETYNASEGFFSIQDDLTVEGMLLMLDYGIFYEFIPVSGSGKDDPKPIPLSEVEVGKNYAMVITTCGGLWRYIIGDTVRFTSVFPHKIVITGRTKHFINAFGEELMVDNADKGIAIASEKTGAVVKEYTVAPWFDLEHAGGKHQWLIEFEKMPASLDEFAKVLDDELKQINSDYEAKRYKNISLQPLEVIVAKSNLFYDWLRMKDKLGGQHKIPRMSNERTMLEELLKLNSPA